MLAACVYRSYALQTLKDATLDFQLLLPGDYHYQITTNLCCSSLEMALNAARSEKISFSTSSINGAARAM